MKQRFLYLAAISCAALAAVFTLNSCREDSIIKSSLTPAVDNIHTFGIGPDFNNGTDTITMLTATVFQDSVNTSTKNTGFPIYHPLGSIVDPFAGKTNASIYTQFVPTTTGVTLPSNTPDSVVLVLPYAGFTWGDTITTYQHQVKVYAISEGFSKDSTFYNYSSKATSSTAIGTATIITGLSNMGLGSIQDSILVGKNAPMNRAPHLRIKLDNNWVTNSFVPAVAALTDSAFTSLFPGLCIMEDSTSPQGSLPYFRLNGGADIYGSAALLVYTNGSDTAMQFPYSETYAAHFGRITRNSNGYPLSPLLDKTKTQETVAMQNAPGVSIDLVLPNLKYLVQQLPPNAIINKAEITFVQVPTGMDDAKFFAPLRLYPQGMNATGGIYTIADRYPINDGSLNFIDGTSSSITRNGTTLTGFRLNIPRELQQAIVAGVSSLHLRIGGTINFPAAYRVVLGGRGNTNAIYRPTLNIIYSKQ